MAGCIRQGKLIKRTSGLYHRFPRHTPGDLAPVTRSQLLRSLYTLSLSTNTVLAPSLYNVDLCRLPRCLKIKTENRTQKYTERRAYVNTGLRHLRGKDSLRRYATKAWVLDLEPSIMWGEKITYDFYNILNLSLSSSSLLFLVWGACTHMLVYVGRHVPWCPCGWRSENNSQELISSSIFTWLRLPGLHNKHVYPLSFLSGPNLGFWAAQIVILFQNSSKLMHRSKPYSIISKLRTMTVTEWDHMIKVYDSVSTWTNLRYYQLWLSS